MPFDRPVYRSDGLSDRRPLFYQQLGRDELAYAQIEVRSILFRRGAGRDV